MGWRPRLGSLYSDEVGWRPHQWGGDPISAEFSSSERGGDPVNGVETPFGQPRMLLEPPFPFLLPCSLDPYAVSSTF